MFAPKHCAAAAVLIGTLATQFFVSVAAEAADAKYEPPRMADGRPSFEGTWNNASITSLQHPSNYKQLVLTADEIAAATQSHPQVVRQRTDDGLDQGAALDGTDLQGGRGYNAFWIDPGTTFGFVKGEYRTSWIVDPADGQIPYNARRSRGDARSSFDGPESRPLGERCIIRKSVV